MNNDIACLSLKTIKFQTNNWVLDMVRKDAKITNST